MLVNVIFFLKKSCNLLSLVTPSSSRDNITQDIFHLASAVVIAATREKSGVCQEWSCDSRAERFLLPEASWSFPHLVQTTAAACLRCQITDTHCQRTRTLPQPQNHTHYSECKPNQTYDPVVEPNCYQLSHCKSKILVAMTMAFGQKYHMLWHKRVELHLSLPLTQPTGAVSGRPVLVYRGLSGMSWLQMPAGLCLSRHLPDPLQPYKGCLNRRGKQMHLSIEAWKHEAGRLLKGEEFKGNLPFIYLPKTAGQLTTLISHRHGFEHTKALCVNAPQPSLIS